GSIMQRNDVGRIYLSCKDDRCICRDKIAGLGRSGWRYFEFEKLFLTYVRSINLEALLQTEQDNAKGRVIAERIRARERQRHELHPRFKNLMNEIETTAPGRGGARIRKGLALREVEWAQFDVDDEKDRQEQSQLLTADTVAASAKDINETIDDLQKP